MLAESILVNHTYSPSRFSSTAPVNITLYGQNIVSNSSASQLYYLDVPIRNLTLSCQIPGQFIFVNGTLPFRITGTWGNYIELVITRQDGFVMYNKTMTYQPYYDFNLTFMTSGLWILTLTASNLVGQGTYTSKDNIIVMDTLTAGCNSPYVDLTIPNGCTAGKTCDNVHPALLATQHTRGSTISIFSNTTNNCPRTVSTKGAKFQ